MAFCITFRNFSLGIEIMENITQLFQKSVFGHFWSKFSIFDGMESGPSMLFKLR